MIFHPKSKMYLQRESVTVVLILRAENPQVDLRLIQRKRLTLVLRLTSPQPLQEGLDMTPPYLLKLEAPNRMGYGYVKTARS